MVEHPFISNLATRLDEPIRGYRADVPDAESAEVDEGHEGEGTLAEFRRVAVQARERIELLDMDVNLRLG